MNESVSASHLGARPKAKPNVNNVIHDAVGSVISANNNLDRLTYHEGDVMANDRLPSDNLHSDTRQFSRPSDDSIDSRLPRTVDQIQPSSSRQRNEHEEASSSQIHEIATNSHIRRPSDLAVNGYCDFAPGSMPTHGCVEEEEEEDSAEERLDSDHFHVLPKELQDNSDFCGLNGECDYCGGVSVEPVNGVVRHSAEQIVEENNREEIENENYDEEGAVGGEDLLLEVLPVRCSPDSGEGEFENLNSHSPSCSWDQQSSSSNDECFYRYRGEDDARQPAMHAHVPNLPENNDRRRSSSPEMDYLEMDFDPNSSDWGADEAGRPPAPEPEPTPPSPTFPLVEQDRRVSPPLPQQLERPSQSRPQEQERPTTATVIARGDVLLWSQSHARELAHPYTTPLTSATNAIFYAMTAMEHTVSRDRVMTFIYETHPSTTVPQTLVSYLHYRASHTSLTSPSSFSQSSHILTGPDIAHAIRMLSGGQLQARFFPILSRNLHDSGNLCSYIIAWLHRGVVSILTYSQVQTEGSRHEMVFGSSDGGLLLMGEPYQVVSESLLRARLIGQGTVAVPYTEILARWRSEQDLRPLMHTSCLAWATHNVLGCVVGMLREATLAAASPSSSPSTSRQPQPQPMLPLPLLCESGITLVCHVTNPHCHLLENCRNFNQ